MLGQNFVNSKLSSSSSSSSSVLGSIEKDVGKEVGKVASTVVSDIAKELNIHDFYSVHILDFCEVSTRPIASRLHSAGKALLTPKLGLGLLHPITHR